jgi:short-subunit dehydrogenase
VSVQRIAIFGATSAIAQHVARRLAERETRFFLVARNAARLDAVAGDLRARGAEVDVTTADLDVTADHAALAATIDERLGGVDVAVFAQGVLGDPEEYDTDGLAAARVIHTNLTAPVSLLTFVSERMASRGSGCIVGLSSIAGDRGRRSNAVYGASKAGFSAFLSGLRSRMLGLGVHVMTVKPGPVDTPMTAAMPRDRPFASPDVVARDIVRAIDRRSDVVYTPWIWRFVMLAVRLIPERWFKKLAV